MDLYVVCISLVIIFITLYFLRKDGVNSTGIKQLLFNFNRQNKKDVDVKNKIYDQNKLYKSNTKNRSDSYKTLVDTQQELATLFYEWGWGTSFHFANKKIGENFKQSIIRHEVDLAKYLKLNPNSKVLDLGCGIGGPYRNIAKYSKSDIIGITINQNQVNRGNELNIKENTRNVKSIQGDFHYLPFDDNYFDAVYAIEAICHSNDAIKVQNQIKRVLKPNGIFACYEWCLTDKYDENDEQHKWIKHKIEEGDGLPNLRHSDYYINTLKSVGMKIVESKDLALEKNNKGEFYNNWYIELTPSQNIFSQRFQFNFFGKIVMKIMLHLFEFIRLAPKGTLNVQKMLRNAAVGLVAGGKTFTFTPFQLIVAKNSDII